MTFSKHLLPFLPTAQLVHGSTGYSVDTLRFHDEVTLLAAMALNVIQLMTCNKHLLPSLYFFSVVCSQTP